jgi:hypothetical protein
LELIVEAKIRNKKGITPSKIDFALQKKNS